VIKSPLFFRGFALSIALIYLANNGFLAHARETNFWKERKTSVQLARLPSPSAAPMSQPLPLAKGVLSSKFLESIPSQFSTLRTIQIPPSQDSDRIIIHIQDVHMNHEAQMNIGKTIQALIQDGKVGLVALEGAFAPIDLTHFKRFPHPETVHNVADFLLGACPA